MGHLAIHLPDSPYRCTTATTTPYTACYAIGIDLRLFTGTSRQNKPMSVPARNRPTCGAKTPNGPCRSDVVMANGRCRVHGGATPKGINHPRNKNYIRTKLPERLAEKYLNAEGDPDLLSLNNEIRLTDIFLQEAISNLDDSPPLALWKSISKEWASLKASQRRGDTESSRRHLDTLDGLIERGYRDSDARAEALDIMDKRRKLVESQSKREIALEQSVPVPQVMMLFSAVGQVVMKYVDSPAQRAALAAELASVVNIQAPVGD
jgi:hypothetical protein